MENDFFGALNSIRLTVSLKELPIVNEIGMLVFVIKTFVINEDCD